MIIMFLSYEPNIMPSWFFVIPKKNIAHHRDERKENKSLSSMRRRAIAAISGSFNRAIRIVHCAPYLFALSGCSCLTMPAIILLNERQILHASLII
jgi:hypothetical protein